MPTRPRRRALSRTRRGATAGAPGRARPLPKPRTSRAAAPAAPRSAPPIGSADVESAPRIRAPAPGRVRPRYPEQKARPRSRRRAWLPTGAPRSRLCRRARRQAASAACPHRARRGAHRTRAPGARSVPPAAGDSSSTGSPASGMARASSTSPSGLPAASASTRLRTCGDSPGATRSSNFSESAPDRRSRSRIGKPVSSSAVENPSRRAGDERHRLVVQAAAR